MQSYKNHKNLSKIGFCTYQDAWTWERGEVASTRIRVYSVAKYMKNAIVSNNFNELKKCDAVIFQTRYEPDAIACAKELVENGKIAILDLTDPHWDTKHYSTGACGTYLGNLKNMIEAVDLVTFPTLYLQLNFFNYYTSKASLVIPDRIDLEMHNKVKSHIDKEEYTILWHGSYGNIISIDELAREDLERLGKEYKLKLVCIYDHTKEYKVEPFKNIKLETIEWSNQKVIEELLKSDISINPKYQLNHWKCYKSNNKTVKAWALGVPCVEKNFYREITCLLSSPEARNIEGKKGRTLVENEYDSKISAKEIENIVKELTIQKRIYINASVKKPKRDVVVYTSICDNYDNLKDSQNTEGADFVAYLDETQNSDVWKVKPYTREFYDPTRDAKVFKVLSHLYLNDYKYSVWIDASVSIKVPAYELVKKYLIDTGSDIAVYKHNQRDCIYEEAKYDLLLRKDRRHIIEPQVARYKAEGHPEHWGLFACTIIFRRNCEVVKKFNEEWWAEICVGSERDQEAFAYLVRKHNMKITIAETTQGKHWNTNEFDNIPHLKPYKLYYSFDKNLVSKDRPMILPSLSSNYKVSFVLLDDITLGILNTSSFKIRDIAPYIPNSCISSDWNVLNESKVIVYQNRFEYQDVDFVITNKNKKIFILDLTDALWHKKYPYSNNGSKSLCRRMIENVSAIVVPTEALKELIEKEFETITIVIEQEKEIAVTKYISLMNELVGKRLDKNYKK